jgi:hypothetical protein
MPVAANVTNNPTTALEPHFTSSDISTFCSTNRHTPAAITPIASLYMTVQNDPRFLLLAIRTTRNATPISATFDKSNPVSSFLNRVKTRNRRP